MTKPSLPKIIFLDAATVDFGDLNLSNLKKCGQYKSFANLPSHHIHKMAKDAEVIISNKFILNKDTLASLKKLKLICVAATGYNNVDVQYAQQRGIAVCNVANYSTTTVAEHTLLFILALSHRLTEHHHSAISGKWSRSNYFSVPDFPFYDVYGKTLGIIGYGTIGKKVGKIAKSFGMTVLAAKIPGRDYKLNTSQQRHSLQAVLEKSDFVSLHTTLNKNTRGLIDAQKLALMKPSAFLINLARGQIVQENDVVSALKNKQIAGYATDVLSTEPPAKNHPLLAKSLQNKVLITPHVAWGSVESRQRMIQEITANIVAFFAGRKRNRVV